VDVDDEQEEEIFIESHCLIKINKIGDQRKLRFCKIRKQNQWAFVRP